MTCDCPTCQAQADFSAEASRKADRVQAFLQGWDTWRLLNDDSQRNADAAVARQALRARLAARKAARA